MEVARLMKEAHDRAYQVLSEHKDQMHRMAAVLMERETVEGEACDALLNNQWEEYLVREQDILAQREKEEAEARALDEQILREREAMSLEEAEEEAKNAGDQVVPFAPVHDPYSFTPQVQAPLNDVQQPSHEEAAAEPEEKDETQR